MATEVPIDYVRENNTELKFLLKQMEQVLHDYKLVGIAAPQIGVSLRVFLMEFTQKHRDNFTKDEYTARDMAVMPLTVSADSGIDKPSLADRSYFYEFAGCHQSSDKGDQLRAKGFF